MKPFTPLFPTPEDEQIGKERLQKAVGVILAAGQGSRLGFAGPKGLFPITQKTLFQIICEKIPRNLQLAIMCSKENLHPTQTYFEENHNFGLQVRFFTQTELPLLDLEGNPLPVTGPDGNGAFYPCFYETLFHHYANMGIEQAMIIPVDNPLADPFNAHLLGFHYRLKNEVSLLTVPLEDKSEKVGLLVEDKGKVKVLEYLHVDPQWLQNLTQKIYININLFCLSFSFIKKIAALPLPYYNVQKSWQGREVLKREKYLFDPFFLATQSHALCYPRRRCYAPLKSQKDIVKVQKALEYVER